MRRILVLLITAALVAAACADGPELEELLGTDTPELPGPDPTPEPDPEPAPETDPGPAPDPGPAGSSFVLPDAPAPEPDTTPLPIDEGYRTGVLENGLTYYARSNDTPGASLDLRLVVDAGSLQQPVGDDGSAHTLEHMLFNGTDRFPGNELTQQLQRLGISFGADINAFTSYDETVYLLGATTFDPTAVGIAFDVLREWASNATIAEADVAAEIGVVRDELRQGRETVDGIVFTEFERIYTDGTPYEGHLVIGEAELVEGLDAATLRAYYDDWYRPDNMAVVVVGDLPLDTIENEIVTRFSDLRARVEDPTDAPEIDIALRPEPRAEIVVQPDNANDYLSLDIQLPVWDTGTIGGERMTLVESMVSVMIGTRLNEAFQRGELDTDTAPGLSSFEVNRGLRYYGTNFQGPDLAVALEQYWSQLLSVAADGFGDDDVARAREVLLASLDDELSGIASTQDFVYANDATFHFLAGTGLDDASRRIDRQRDVVEAMTAGELTDFWRWLLGHSGPILIEVGDDAADMPTAAELLDVLAAARPVGAATGAAAIDALMATPPEPAEVVDTRVVPTFDGDITEWTFANGVVVSHLRTQITEGTFNVRLESTGGWSTFDDVSEGLAAVSTDAVLGSGVGPHDAATLARYLESRDASVSASIDQFEEIMDGAAATDDAVDLFELLHLTITEPRVDDVAFRSAIRSAEDLLEIAQTDADTRLQLELIDLASGGDPRTSFLVPAEELAALDGTRAREIFTSRYGLVDDLHVAIVGDIEAGPAGRLAARYLGTLPQGPPDTWVDPGDLVPSETRRGEVELVDDTANGGIVVFDWLLTPADDETDVAAQLLSGIVSNVIVDVIREELGASYGGFANVALDRSGPGGYFSFIQVDGDPARLDEIRSTLFDALDRLSTEGPSADEFERAFAVIDNDFQFIDDGLFLTANLARTRYPDDELLEPDERSEVLRRLDRADIRDLAARLYGDGVFVEVTKVLP